MLMICPKTKRIFGLALLLAMVLQLPTLAQDARRRNQPRRDAALVNQPADVATMERMSIILGRPTDRSITANVLAKERIDIFLELGTASGGYSRKTPVQRLEPDSPLEIEVPDLAADTLYFYRPRYRAPGAAEFATCPQQQFHTQRASGQRFTFELQGDSHPERPQQFDASLYAQTLRNAANDRPDFYITMGDDFSVDTLDSVTPATVAQRYRLQRPYLALVGQTAPIFMVNGNHEQASLANLDGGPDNVAVWGQTARNRLFPLPAPNQFYSGDGVSVPHIGLLRDYYAWTWGDALFMVIDPYWHSNAPVDNAFAKQEKARTRDQWNITLGEAQYQWLKSTLESSKARYKFVFSHHVLGTGRGGIEQAGLFEWGGSDRRGVNSFASHRPGWDLPIHQLMVKNGVTVFFQGHDHVFARQVLDGVTYQTLPQPANPNYALYFQNVYQSGDIYPNTGRVRVTVDAAKVRVEYVRSYRAADANAERVDNAVATSYEVPYAGR